MSKKFLYLALIASALSLTSNVSAALVARWTFNNSPNDQVGALHWALNGGATYATDSKEGSHCLQCDGVDDYASLTGAGLMANAFSVKTVMLWFKANATTGTQVLYDEGGYTNGLAIRLNNGALEAAIQDNQILLTISTPFSSTSWAHVAITFGASTFTLFLDGTEVGSVATSFVSVRSHTNVAGLGARNGQDAFDGATTGDYYGGLIDDVQMYDEALSPAFLREIMLGRPTPWNPAPSDGALDVTSPLFTWTAGGTAQWHDLYLGTDPNLGPQDLVGPRQVVAMYWHVPGLTPGTTYYWRVDAVEAGGAVWTGPVWTFMYAPVEAWQPVPADGAQYMALNPTLSWTKGLNAIAHELYLGADKAAVSEGAAAVFRGNQMTTTFQAGSLQSGTTYYWRVDEVAPDGTKVKGHVWSFETVPEIPVTNPNLAAWWPLDEGAGRRVVDRSGHGHHGDFVGTMTWANGYDGSALACVGLAGEYVEISGYDGVLGRQDRTCTAWIQTTGLGAILSWGQAVTSQKWIFRVQNNNGNAGALRVEVEGGRIVAWRDLRDNEWHHVAAVLQSTGAPTVSDIRLYVDGLQEAISDSLVVDINSVGGRNVWIGNDHSGRPFPGRIDDVRIYDKALSQEELDAVLRIDPLRAWQPQPATGATADIRTATPLTWTKGDNASKHDIYFGTDAVAVADANAADTTGIYRGRISATSFTPSEGVDWGQKYFWRVDEVNTDGSLTAGKVWTFTVAGYLIVDDFESYTDIEAEAIFSTWIDGYTNGLSGSTVGNLTAPFAERTIVYSGRQAMPLDYNNTKTPFYSEAERMFSPVEDWTFGDANTLVVHFRGQPADFLESAGTFTLGAAGVDIWNTADEFRYVFKRLTGDGSIVARVDSIANTNVWAKGGVMIRESLDPGSRHAMVVATPGSGVAFQRRLITNDVSVGTTQAGITAPRWLKLTRTGNTLTAQHSADGVTWTDVVGAAGTTTSDTVVMGGTIYIGLALTSHAANVACTAVFSEVSTTGTVTGAWTQAEIGVDHPGNSPQGLYVGIEDSAGKVAFVTHADPVAATLPAWTEWSIPLSDFTGVNPARIKKMYVGVGDRKNPVPDGAGRIYIDDIRVTKP